MELNLFGYQLKKKAEPTSKPENSSPIMPSAEDGSTVMSTSSSYYSTVLDFEGAIKSENDLIRRYRDTAMYPDVDSAIEDIVNEAISAEDDEKVVVLQLDDLKVGDPIKKKIEAEFTNVLRLLKFEDRAHEIFRHWYIDGRMYYNMIIDKTKEKDGIKELRYVDPRKIRKIKNVLKEKTPTGVDVVKGIEEYYIYSDKGISGAALAGVKMSLDSVIYVPSGNYDADSGLSLSFLHKAIKPVNQLKMLEDAMVIYRITRAPERRIFYVDVGNLPKMKAEQYVTDIMNKFKNKIVYDAQTGEVRDDRKHMSMMEDFWMPRREGGKGTEITTLPGLQNANNTDDVTYFQTKVFQALNVPMSRLQQGTAFSLGRSSEITRDEIKFAKFTSRLRRKFSQLFLELLKYQLVLKGIINLDEWPDMSQCIKFDYTKDNHFAEFKNNEIITQRLSLLQLADPYVGKYYSQEWVRKNILVQDDLQIKEINKEIESEKDSTIDDAAHQGQLNQLQQGSMGGAG